MDFGFNFFNHTSKSNDYDINEDLL